MKKLSKESHVSQSHVSQPQPRSKFWRIVIPNLLDYRDSTPEQLKQLKCLILQRLLAKETKRGLQYYRIALEHHVNGVPHLDILITYHISKQHRLTDWDYLLSHGNVTSYRQLRKAIIQYGTKQDKHSLTNFPADTTAILQIQCLLRDPYAYFQLQMRKDPLHFNLQQYCHRYQFFKHIKGWASIKSKLRDAQLAAANFALKSRPGIPLITRARVQACLTPAQLRTYDGWYGYQTIVNYLNQLVQYGCERPFKSRQLLLVGPPNTGKTSLINTLQEFYAIYHMDVTNWFPRYLDGTYKLISWNEFKLKGGMTHTTLLKYLQGYPIDLQYKGGSSLRRNRQLIIMSSNMTLSQHLNLKFKVSFQRRIAQANLGVRIEQLVLPPKLDLFLLAKLIRAPAISDI